MVKGNAACCKQILISSFAVFFFLCTVSFNSFAQPGVLDVTFGNKGKVVTPLTGVENVARSMALQKDGKIVMAGYSYVNNRSIFAVVRYNPNGILDTTFGSGGSVTTIIGMLSDEANAVVIQPDGNILVAGTTQITNINSDFALIRLTPNGKFDSAFGMNGIVKTDFSNGYDNAKFLLLRPDGKILAGGEASYISNEFGLAQYKPNGSLDSTFGISGKTHVTVGTNFSLSFAGAIQPDGKIVMGGGANDVSQQGEDIGLVRFQLTGNIDSSFGTNGKVKTNIYGNNVCYALSILSNGKIVVSGETTDSAQLVQKVALLRYNSNGTLDNTFGNNGKTSTDIAPKDDLATSLQILPNGKIIVGGISVGGTYNTHNPTSNFALLRYNDNGVLDSSFGKHGIVTTDFAGFNDESLASAIQSDGKIILAGKSTLGSTNNFALARYEQNALVNYNTVKGSVFLDNNSNGTKDVTEPFFTQANIVTTKKGIDTISSVSYGQFSVGIDTGLYVTNVIPYSPYYTVVPAFRNTSFATYFNTDSVSFAVQPIPGKRDVTVSIIPIGVARPGFPVQYKIFYQNQGTDTVPNGTVQLVKNSKLNFSSASPAATSVNGDTLRWNFVSFKPLDTAGIIVNLLVQAPPAVNVGDTLRSTAAISAGTDLTPGDNTSTVVQRVAGSYDPNGKTEGHGGKINVSQVSAGEYLQYTIRFQNTGTDTAFNVYLRDTLSSKLDWSTFQMISSSHNYQLTISDGNLCSWAFSNINLADSNKNEPLSHGYLVYRIKPKTTVSSKDTIYNAASIFFDYNLPVATNREKTEIAGQALPLTLLAFIAQKADKANLLQWSTASEVNVAYFNIEKSTNGSDYETTGKRVAGSATYTFTDNNPLSAINYYRLKMVDKDGQFSYSPVRVVDNSGSLYALLYPNPVTNKLTLSITVPGNQTVLLQLVSAEGKVILSNQVPVSKGINLKQVNVAALRRGSYWLRIVVSDKEQTVLKFQKL